VQAAELKQFLNPVDGQLSKFYDTIKLGLDGSLGQLKTREQGNFNPQFIVYLNGMLQLRDALFPGNSEQPKLDFTVALKSPSSVTAEMIIGDARVRSENGTSQQQNASWPPTGTLGVTVNKIRQDGQTELLAQYQDTWGLFKMLSNAKSSSGLYTIYWGDVQARVQLSGNNDRFWTKFAQLRAPQNFK